MYLGPPRRKKKRSSPFRVFVLTILILFGIYIIRERPQWARPFEPTPTPTRSAESYLEEAEDLYLEGDLDGAIAAYRAALALQPDDALTRAKLARLLTVRNRTEEAVKEARRAVEQERRAETLAVLGMALDWNAQPEEALQVCLEAVNLDPNYAEGYACQAEALADLGDWNAALEAGEQAVSLDDRSVDAHRTLGYVLEVQQKYKEAIVEYEKAIALHPKLGYLYISLGLNYRVLGQYDKALEQFQKATQVDPNNPAGYDQLGLTHYYQGDHALALVEFKRALEIDPNFALGWGHLGWVYYFGLKNYEEAIHAFEKALEIGGLPLGREAEFQIELGWCRYFFDGCEAAVPHFEAALDLLEGKEDQGYWSLADQAWEGLDACSGK